MICLPKKVLSFGIFDLTSTAVSSDTPRRQKFSPEVIAKMIRSNYFAVKDVPSYRQFCRRWNLRRIEDDQNRYGFIDKSSSYFQSSEEKGEYMLGWSSDGEEDPDADYEGEDDDLPIEPSPDALFSEQLAAVLAYENVAIVMEIDHDKTRYLIGYAWAVNSKHEVRSIYLSDIYAMAEELGKNITRAEW